MWEYVLGWECNREIASFSEILCFKTIVLNKWISFSPHDERH